MDIRVGADQIPLLRGKGGQALQGFLAAESLLDRKQIGELTVVPSPVPADQTEFRMVDALFPEFADHVAYPVKCDSRVNRRRIVAILFENLRRHRLPPHADANLRTQKRLFQNRLCLHPFAHGTACTSFQLVFSVTPGEPRRRSTLPFKPEITDHEILKRTTFQRETRINVISTVFYADHQFVIHIHTGDDGKNRPGFFCGGVKRHIVIPVGGFRILSFSEFSKHGVMTIIMTRDQEKAGIALPRGEKVIMK